MFAPTTPIGSARRALAETLRGGGVENADLDARILVCAACGVDHAALIRAPDMPLGPGATTLIDYARRRLAREPVARILSRREFWGLSLHVDADVLDPRADTESLIGAVLDAIGNRRDLPLKILDLGTGSGAILCALLSELPLASGVGVDRSSGACRTAARNLADLGLAERATIVCGTWGDSLRDRFDVVASNPPYIPHDDITGLAADVRDYDPVMALDGGADGLDAFRTIAPQLATFLLPGGIAAVECGWDQGETVAGLMRETGLHSVVTHKDLSGHDRVVSASWQAELCGSESILLRPKACFAKALGVSVESA